MTWVTSVTPWTRFVLARLDEDEDAITRYARRLRAGAQAQEVRPGAWSVERMRAEVAAKRQLMGTLQELLFLRDLPMERPVRDAALEMVKTLAAPYRDHREHPSRPDVVANEPVTGNRQPIG